jgi:hypothetical protein
VDKERSYRSASMVAVSWPISLKMYWPLRLA